MQSLTPSPQVISHLQTILRRDLKLGPDAPIPADMPFFGGDVDLDSLDILLLVTSIEKEFGVKIPSENIGKEIFQNVSTLARYVEQNIGNGAPGGGAQPAAAAIADPLAQLPHGPEFRFVTKLTSHRPGENAVGVWEVKGDEPFFKGHFPGKPLVPGVLLAEALAQISGLASPAGGAEGMLAKVDVRFSKAVAPPAQIMLHAKLERVLGELQQFEVSARVGDEVVASGSIMLHRPAAS